MRRRREARRSSSALHAERGLKLSHFVPQSRSQMRPINVRSSRSRCAHRAGLVLHRIQVAQRGVVGGHGLQVRDAYDLLLFSVIADCVHAILAGWERRRCAMVIRMLAHLYPLLWGRAISSGARAVLMVGKPEIIFLATEGKGGRHGEKIPCRSPATVVSLRSETLRPCLSACLPSAAHDTPILPPGQYHHRHG